MVGKYLVRKSASAAIITDTSRPDFENVRIAVEWLDRGKNAELAQSLSVLGSGELEMFDTVTSKRRTGCSKSIDSKCDSVVSAGLKGALQPSLACLPKRPSQAWRTPRRLGHRRRCDRTAGVVQQHTHRRLHR